MTIEVSSSQCLICDASLESERELEIGICFACRRYGLLTGHWPDAPDANDIARSLHLALIGNDEARLN